MRRLTSAVCVVALGVGTAGCMATGNENVMAHLVLLLVVLLARSISIFESQNKLFFK